MNENTAFEFVIESIGGVNSRGEIENTINHNLSAEQSIKNTVALVESIAVNNFQEFKVLLRSKLIDINFKWEYQDNCGTIKLKIVSNIILQSALTSDEKINYIKECIQHHYIKDYFDLITAIDQHDDKIFEYLFLHGWTKTFDGRFTYSHLVKSCISHILITPTIKNMRILEMLCQNAIKHTLPEDKLKNLLSKLDLDDMSTALSLTRAEFSERFPSSDQYMTDLAQEKSRSLVTLRQQKMNFSHVSDYLKQMKEKNYLSDTVTLIATGEHKILLNLPREKLNEFIKLISQDSRFNFCVKELSTPQAVLCWIKLKNNTTLENIQALEKYLLEYILKSNHILNEAESLDNVENIEKLEEVRKNSSEKTPKKKKNRNRKEKKKEKKLKKLESQTAESSLTAIVTTEAIEPASVATESAQEKKPSAISELNQGSDKVDSVLSVFEERIKTDLLAISKSCIQLVAANNPQARDLYMFSLRYLIMNLMRELKIGCININKQAPHASHDKKFAAIYYAANHIQNHFDEKEIDDVHLIDLVDFFHRWHLKNTQSDEKFSCIDFCDGLLKTDYVNSVVSDIHYAHPRFFNAKSNVILNIKKEPDLKTTLETIHHYLAKLSQLFSTIQGDIYEAKADRRRAILFCLNQMGLAYSQCPRLGAILDVSHPLSVKPVFDLLNDPMTGKAYGISHWSSIKSLNDVQMLNNKIEAVGLKTFLSNWIEQLEKPCSNRTLFN